MSLLARLAWPATASCIFHGLKWVTLSTVRGIDEGGLDTLMGDAPLVIVANHQSHADTAVLHSLLPRQCRSRVRFVASSVRFARGAADASRRERLERWLLNGLAVHAYRSILVGGELNGLRSVDALTEALRDGAAIAMYPEGTRSRDGRLGALKPGVAMLAIATGCAIVPVRLDGTLEALPKSIRFPRMRNRVFARFRPPIVADENESHASLLARIASALSPEEPTP